MNAGIPRGERTYAVLDHYQAAPAEWEAVLVLGMPNRPDESSSVTVLRADGRTLATLHARVINYLAADELGESTGTRILADGFEYAGETPERALELAAEAWRGVVLLDSEMGD